MSGCKGASTMKLTNNWALTKAECTGEMASQVTVYYIMLVTSVLLLISLGLQ